MLHTVRASLGESPEFTSSARELLQATARNLILTIGGIATASLIAVAFWPEFGQQLWIASPLIVIICGLTLALLPRHYLLAQLILQVGLAGAIALLLHLFRAPELAYLYALLPLIAIITVGLPAGILTVVLTWVLARWLSNGTLMALLPSPYAWGIAVGGIIAGAVGWASVHTLLTVVQWSLYSFKQAQRNMEDARAHRAKLSQTVKELDQAYHRLERANHMLVLARAEAEEAKEARNRFALAISHELRAPLNFIIGFSELMVNNPDTYGDLQRWPCGLYEDIQEIHRSSVHLLSLVNDVLDLGQIENLEMPLHKEWIDPESVVREVQAMMQPAYDRKRLTFSAEIEPDLPRVFADHIRIRQVLLNLVNNGLRFTDEGGITVKIHRESTNRLLFCVEDTGQGIAEEDIPKVFEDFQQLETQSWRKREGTGLGIPISRRFIELHGGRMWIETEVGQGTAFYFTLPVMAKTHAEISANIEAGNASRWRLLEENAKAARTILVLSEDPAAADVMTPYVKDYKIVPVQAVDQIEVQIEHYLPCALFIDHAMVRHDERTSIVEHLPYTLPIVSFVFPGSPVYGENLPPGVTDYLIKPVSPQVLIDAVSDLGRDVRNLLVVDHDPAMGRFVTQALNSAPAREDFHNRYQLTHALTEEAALKHLEQGPTQAILLDPTVSSAAGRRLLEKARARGLPIILVTAYEEAQVLATSEPEVLRVAMARSITRHELSKVLTSLLDALHPTYPAIPTATAHPTGVSASRAFGGNLRPPTKPPAQARSRPSRQ
jgi:signal transduction histidine kinase/CheY-like chemotaxis protein